ncbi:uncharacterized protein ATC70_011854 [Mucor velutinosus]|uniref:Uncharacterized protein n=1 Tax=Mucor velutinosus TaxID=708070 RepID=A0AAN7D958_9FUNG|nr:hypothetical protein ATC70_011854 [Mucor velutinosus]
MDSPQTFRKQLPFYGRHNSEFLANSSTTSLHSSSNNSSNLLLSNRSSAYTPNIERQLNSLVVEDDDTQKDTAELLQQTFDQLDTHHFTQAPSQTKIIDPYHTRVIILAWFTKTMTVCKCQDFSAFTYPFSEQPVITGKTITGFYIPTPTSIRNYLDYPDASVLKDMILPYPFRVKEPVSQRLERLDSSSPFMAMNSQQPPQRQWRKKSNESSTALQQHPIKPSKRHSLALGQVDRIVRKNSMRKTDTLLKPQEPAPKSKQRGHTRTASVNSDLTQDIITWMPDQNTDWAQETDAHAPLNSIPSDANMPLRLHIPWHNELSRGVGHTGAYTDNPLHPLDHTENRQMD